MTVTQELPDQSEVVTLFLYSGADLRIIPNGVFRNTPEKPLTIVHIMEREQLNFYLQQIPVTEIISLRREIEDTATVELIQKPTSQTLLVPVHDPINEGTFLSGEVLVTSSIVRINNTNGWAMVMDDNPEQAVSIAILDAAFAANILKKNHPPRTKGQTIQQG